MLEDQKRIKGDAIVGDQILFFYNDQIYQSFRIKNIIILA